MEEKKEIPGLLQMLTRPGFYVKDFFVCQVNPSAASLMIRTGEDIREWFLTGLEEYESQWDGCLCVTLSLAGKAHAASVLRTEEGDLFLPEQDADSQEFRALSLASMELRRPLSNVMNLAEQLLADTEGENKDKATSMNRSLYQMLRILGNMSDVGTLGSRFRPEMQNVTCLLEEIFARAGAYIAGSGITLTYEGLPELILSQVDAEQLERAVLNIVSNAAKFTPAGGTVRASLVRRNKQLRLTISDSGSGIARDVMDSVFYRYLRQPGIEDNRHGLGLGMTLIRIVAANHGGTVLIDRSPEGGTRVTLTMTIRQSADVSLRSLRKLPDYAGERDHALVELSDCLSAELYDGTK